MYITTFLLSFLFTTTTTSALHNHPQQPITSPPSEHALSTSTPPASDEFSLIHGTIDIHTVLDADPIPVAYSISPRTCTPLLHETSNIIADLYLQMRSEQNSKQRSGFAFPLSSSGSLPSTYPQTSLPKCTAPNSSLASPSSCPL